MKLAELKITGLAAVAVVVVILVVAVAITSQDTGNVEFRVMLDKPMRDITIGHAVGFLVLAWILFK